ncbi:MAG: right-handed parallel beta-helix repeat-containing protein [Desulfopila sp.]|nr:right-handed parallel beta-helix repeat-containing protein [Desulfopila sp.]
MSPSAFPDASFSYLIDLDSHGWTGPVHSIKVSGCKLYSTASSGSWSREDWNSKAKNGISVDGTDMTVSHNSLTNVNFGISVGASHSLIEWNRIENFSGDGLRGLGDHTVFQYNTIKNCYDVNDNHDDGFQSWSVGADGKVGTGVVTGIVLRGNTIINYEDSRQPFRGALQGIGCFDGMFKDWTVEKNIIKVDHWHGISLYGAINVVIQNNIVTDLNAERPGPPWIWLRDHKNGTPPRDSLVMCNVAPSVRTDSGPNNVVQYNTISDTGWPRHPSCPSSTTITPMLPLLLQDN